MGGRGTHLHARDDAQEAEHDEHVRQADHVPQRQQPVHRRLPGRTRGGVGGGRGRTRSTVGESDVQRAKGVKERARRAPARHGAGPRGSRGRHGSAGPGVLRGTAPPGGTEPADPPSYTGRPGSGPSRTGRDLAPDPQPHVLPPDAPLGPRLLSLPVPCPDPAPLVSLMASPHLVSHPERPPTVLRQAQGGCACASRTGVPAPRGRQGRRQPCLCAPTDPPGPLGSDESRPQRCPQTGPPAAGTRVAACPGTPAGRNQGRWVQTAVQEQRAPGPAAAILQGGKLTPRVTRLPAGAHGSPWP